MAAIFNILRWMVAIAVTIAGAAAVLIVIGELSSDCYDSAYDIDWSRTKTTLAKSMNGRGVFADKIVSPSDIEIRKEPSEVQIRRLSEAAETSKAKPFEGMSFDLSVRGKPDIFSGHVNKCGAVDYWPSGSFPPNRLWRVE